MYRSSWVRPGLLFLVVSLAAACGGAKPPPVTPAASAPATSEAPAADLSPNTLRDRRGEAGVRAPARPLVIGKASSAKCGKLAKAAPDGPTSELLGGRLLVRAPEGAKIPTPLPEAPPIEEESRVVVEPSSEKEKLSLAIVARETFQLDPDMYEAEPDAPSKPGTLDVEAPKFLKATFPSEQPLEVTPVEIGNGATKMRAYAARPRQPNAPPGRDTALVLALLLAQEDGTLESLGFYVRGETVRHATGSDLVGCTRLAERISSTLVPGPRKLERAAGTRKLADVPPRSELAITVPDDYVAIPSADGARLYKLRPISLYPGSISIHLADGGEPKLPEGAEATAPGKLLGRPTEWRGQTSPKGGFFFTAEPLDTAAGKTAEVLVKATRQAKALDEFRAVAETLAVVKKD